VLNVERDTELALVAGLHKGDGEAFDAIYAAHRARVFAYLFRMCRRRSLAEDLSQEVWIRLARSARKLAPDTRLRPWLFTVARNLMVTHTRWRAVDGQSIDALVFASRLSDVETPEQLAIAQQTGARLESALAALPADQREALLLVTVEQLSPTDVAAILGVRPETLRQRLSRARQSLAQSLLPTVQRKSQ